MTADYFDTEKTGGSKDSIEITVDVKAEKVMDFANEIRNATLDEVLEIISRIGILNAYDRPSFWFNKGMDYKVIDTKYHRGYDQALADVEREVLTLKGGERMRSATKEERESVDCYIIAISNQYRIKQD